MQCNYIGWDPNGTLASTGSCNAKCTRKRTSKCDHPPPQVTSVATVGSKCSQEDCNELSYGNTKGIVSGKGKDQKCESRSKCNNGEGNCVGKIIYKNRGLFQ